MKSRFRDKWIRKLIREKIDLIESVYAPDKLIVFGSRVRAESSEESDLDLVLVSRFFESTPFLGRMAHFLKTIRFPRHIDAFCYTPEEFERKSRQIGVIQEALREGISIIDKGKPSSQKTSRKTNKA